VIALFCHFTIVKKKYVLIFDVAAEVISEAPGIGDLTCIDQNSLSFPISISCGVGVEISCFADEANGFTVPCDEFNPLEGNVDAGCEHVLKYVYTVSNIGPVDDVIQSVFVTRDGTSYEILDQEFNLEPGKVRDVEEYVVLDYCQVISPEFTTRVEVTGKCYLHSFFDVKFGPLFISIS
jgi:hypothetical protein